MSKSKLLCKPDITTWEMPSFATLFGDMDMEKILKKAVSATIEIAMEEKAEAFFPIQFDDFGKQDDPAILCVGVPLGPYTDKPAVWPISLVDVTKFAILAVEEDDFEERARGTDALRAISAMFRDCANRLDLALDKLSSSGPE